MVPKRLVRLSQYALFLVTATTLSYVAFALAESAFFQAYAGRCFDRALDTNALHSYAPAANTVSGRFGGSLTASGRPVIGRLEIPAIHFSSMVLEGDDSHSLRLGVGHITGTAWPGQPGNMGIAGHRDTFFRPLRNIARNDRIQLTALDRSYEYVVDSIRVVGPDDIQVLAASRAPSLTLVTCYPFQYTGPAPRRFIVHARLVR